MRPIAASLAAGAMGGVAAIAVFLTVHHVWILPIWSIAPVGIPVAAATGASVGWAAHEARAALPRDGTRAGLVVASWMALPLVAMEGVPLVAPIASFQATATTPLPEMIARLVAGIVLATLAGAALGYALLRRARGAMVFAVAGLLVALSLGHNTPFVIADPRVLKLWTIMLAALLTAGLTFGVLRDRLGTEAAS